MRKYLILAFVCLLFVVDSKAQVEITSGGTSTAYTLNVPGVFPLRNGIQVTFKAHTACSAAATMNVSGTGALPIRKDGNTSALVGGDIKSGQIVTLAYDGSNWQMMSPSGNAVSIPSTYWDPNGSDIYNNNGGNVGVGVIAPASKLDVSGDINTTDVYKIDGETFLNNRSTSTLVGNTLNSTLSGQYNTFVGEGAGAGSTTPMRNTFVGRYAGNGNVTGSDNTSLGAQAGWQANSSYNTSVGAYSNSGLTFGGFNTSLGYGAGQSNTTGTNNTIIGANANVDVTNLQYATAIGAGASVGQSYSLVLGGTGANAVKVGIGTTTPAENLQISSSTNANISLIGAAASSHKLYFGSTAFAYLGAVEYDNSSNSMNFWTNNTPNRIYIDNAGKVGIGNNAPSSTLHVTGNARVTGLVGPGTVIADASGNLSVAAGATITGSGTNNYLARWTPSGSQLGIGLIYDNGTNLGIGTTSPTNILSFGNASDRKIWIESSSGNTVGRALTISSGNSGLGFNNVNGGDMIIQAGVGTGSGSSSIIFQNGTTLGNSPTAQTMSTKMVILGNGNVGIGTTAPSEALHVVGNFQFTGALMPSGSTGTSGQVLQSNGAGAPSWVTLPTGASAWTRTSPYIYTTTLTDNVGIGISNPGHPLQINENGQNPYIHFTDDITGTAMTDGLIMGTNGAGAMYILGQETTTHLNIGTPGANNLMRFWGTTDRISVDNAASPTSPSALFGVNNTGAETTTNYASIISNLATNTTTDGINKIGLQINNIGTFTGLAGTVTRNYGLFIGAMSGADENYSAVFQTGNVGIGTTTPTERLQVTGNIMIPAANDYLYATAKTNYMSVSAASFTSDASLAYFTAKTGSTSNFCYISGGTLGSIAYSSVGINLPHDAVITGITASIYDNDATYDSRIRLYRLQPGLATAVASTAFTAGASATNQSVSTGAIAVTVDNQNYYYQLTWDTTQGLGNTMRLYGIYITYTVLKAD